MNENENKKICDELEIETIEKIKVFLKDLSDLYENRNIDSIIITAVFCDCLSNFCTLLSIRSGMKKENFFNLVSNIWDRNVEFVNETKVKE